MNKNGLQSAVIICLLSVVSACVLGFQLYQQGIATGHSPNPSNPLINQYNKAVSHINQDKTKDGHKDEYLTIHVPPKRVDVAGHKNEKANGNPVNIHIYNIHKGKTREITQQGDISRSEHFLSWRSDNTLSQKQQDSIKKNSVAVVTYEYKHKDKTKHYLEVKKDL